MKFIGVNGILSDGVETTDVLLNELKRMGYETHDVRQPRRHTWEARFKAELDAQAIIKVADDGDVLIAHSYGCLKSAIAMEHVNFSAAFLFRPAMSRNYKFPKYNDTRIYCIHSLGDRAIWLGGLLRFNHPFGWAGLFGFNDPDIVNLKSKGPHSEDFETGNVGGWAEFIQWELQTGET